MSIEEGDWVVAKPRYQDLYPEGEDGPPAEYANKAKERNNVLANIYNRMGMDVREGLLGAKLVIGEVNEILVSRGAEGQVKVYNIEIQWPKIPGVRGESILVGFGDEEVINLNDWTAEVAWRIKRKSKKSKRKTKSKRKSKSKRKTLRR